MLDAVEDELSDDSGPKMVNEGHNTIDSDSNKDKKLEEDRQNPPEDSAVVVSCQTESSNPIDVHLPASPGDRELDTLLTDFIASQNDEGDSRGAKNEIEDTGAFF